jgi:glucose/arabinose dehydrogenase
MKRPLVRGVIAAFLLLGPGLRLAHATPSLPANFVVENAVPGVAFDIPTSVAYFPDGSMLVSEKRGRVWRVTNGVRAASPLWAHENEVLDQHDRGLLCVAVDPNYATNRHVYMLYTVDPD